MIVWMAGVIAVVVSLMVVIVVLEPEGEGITRAQAFKAAALLTASKEQCQSREEESEGSHFSLKEQGNWFVKYMDYLYDEGYLTEEQTPPTLAAAQGQLTYGEAAQIAGKADRKLGWGHQKQPGQTISAGTVVAAVHGDGEDPGPGWSDSGYNGGPLRHSVKPGRRCQLDSLYHTGRFRI